MRPSRLASPIALLALSLLGLPLAFAQQTGVELTEVSTEKWYMIEGDDVPMYARVWGFFRNAALWNNDPRRKPGYLRDLRIEPGSEVQLLFEETIAQACEILDVRTFDPQLEGEAFTTFQDEAVQRKAARMGVLWQRFLADLETAGYDVAFFESFVKEDGRTVTSILTSGDPKTHTDHSALAFDAAVANPDAFLHLFEEQP